MTRNSTKAGRKLKKPQAFLLGVVGALAPEVLRLYNGMTQQAAVTVQFTWSYGIITLLFLVMAGLFTMFWGVARTRDALAFGLSLPLIINTGGKPFLKQFTSPSTVQQVQAPSEFYNETAVPTEEIEMPPAAPESPAYAQRSTHREAADTASATTVDALADELQEAPTPPAQAAEPQTKSPGVKENLARFLQLL